MMVIDVIEREPARRRRLERPVVAILNAEARTVALPFLYRFFRSFDFGLHRIMVLLPCVFACISLSA
jgi:hypothetical protein